ncbi:MAG TPA: hypothetical protein DCQ98_18545 [Planctomycetaceae bacterium]|nr:hypothetical protein [Planctomycetaceae bacterium]HRF00143.1 hypothetical protein [Pirellulaceae bacterium]
MSKCHIRFEFDRPNRTYIAGETVSGRALVTANQTVAMRGIKLAGLWRTHGKGNTDTGTYFESIGPPGELRAGEQHVLPFSFPTPSAPLTYRGTIVNFDHYVEVRVDVPWAFDPVERTEFILLPGPSVESPDEPLAGFAKSSTTCGLILGGTIGAVAVLVGLAFVMHWGLGLIPIGIGLAILFFTFRNRIAERRLGAIEYVVAPMSQPPGGEFGVRLAFVPRSNGRITAVLLTLRGQETAVSGSGTNKTTHRHVLHDAKIEAARELSFTAGKQVVIEAAFPCPETVAYSYASTENKVEWAIDVRFDIPRWPDWFASQSVRVVPLPSAVAGNAIDTAASDSVREIELIPAPLLSPESELPHAGAMPPVADPVPRASEPIAAPLPYTESYSLGSPAPTAPLAPRSLDLLPLRTLVDSLARGDLTESERSSRIAIDTARDFDIALTVDRVAYSYGIQDAPEYRSGRTVIGSIDGSNRTVAVQLPDAENDRVGDLRSGDRWQGSGRPLRWDTLYERLELRGRST